MKRIALLIIMLTLSFAVLAQEKPKPQPAASEVKPFTPKQVEQLNALDSQFKLAQANERAAKAEAELAQEKIRSVIRDACYEGGIALDECTVAPKGAGVIRVAKPKKPPETEP
jgi:hypothetical protein